MYVFMYVYKCVHLWVHACIHANKRTHASALACTYACIHSQVLAIIYVALFKDRFHRHVGLGDSFCLIDSFRRGAFLTNSTESLVCRILSLSLSLCICLSVLVSLPHHGVRWCTLDAAFKDEGGGGWQRMLWKTSVVTSCNCLQGFLWSSIVGVGWTTPSTPPQTYQLAYQRTCKKGWSSSLTRLSPFMRSSVYMWLMNDLR